MIPQFEFAAFVWTSYAIFAIIVAWQIIQPIWRRRRLEAEIREEMALNQGEYSNDTHP